MATIAGQSRRGEDRGISGVLAHLSLLAATAVLLGLTFPRVGVAWLAHWALVPAVVLAARASGARRLAWTSWLVFFVWWLVMARWLAMVTVGGYIGASIVLALYPMGSLLLVRWFDRRYRMPLVVALPLAWVSLEFLRGQFLAGGFGWFVLGHTQAPFHDGQQPGKLLQTADLFGEHTVGLLVAMTNGLLADLCLRRWTYVSPSGRPRLCRALPAGTALWLAVMGVAWLYGRARLAETEALWRPGPRITVIQTNAAQDNRDPPTAEEAAADFAALISLTHDAAADGPPPDLVVWPETMVPRPLNPEAREGWPDAEDVESAVTLTARQVRASLVAGASAELDFQPFELPDGATYLLPRRRYNSAYVYYPDGALAGRYDKVHRVPFGEYIPWVEWSPWLKGMFIRMFSPWGYDYTLKPGERFVRFTVPLTWRDEDVVEGERAAVVRFATPICFEDAIPRVCRSMVFEDGDKKADLLVNLTNDGWYPGTMQGAQHLQIAALRCVENRVPMARSVNTGISGFIDSTGRIGPLVKIDSQVQQVAGFATHRVQLDPRVPPFARWGEWPMWLMFSLTLLLTVAGWWRPSRMTR